MQDGLAIFFVVPITVAGVTKFVSEVMECAARELNERELTPVESEGNVLPNQGECHHKKRE